ncbi:hypothetical protein [Acrocarpospora catenulata]|uniref:hypothetical protein n=1 Tax=Acrocarpospora catenulata TaxID=2836182 RepID=UPI001BD9B9CF|nr:hypothetical protein [Acrocarpospora catenulata]
MPTAPNPELFGHLIEPVKFVFSWAGLMPIAIIISGRFIAELMKLSGRRTYFFQIKIPRFIGIFAKDDEVVFGFGAFIVTLLTVGLVGGRGSYEMFRERFGLDLGQFTSTCVLSALTTVAITTVILLANRAAGALRRKTDPTLQEHQQMIEDLAAKRARPVPPGQDEGDNP